MISEIKAISYCCEDIRNIENYNEAVSDPTQVWVCHHRNGITLNKTAKELKLSRLYYQRPASELIFLTKDEHSRVHFTGKKLSAETIEKIRAANLSPDNPNRGRTPWNKGKTGIYSDESLQKMSDSRKGKYGGVNHPMYGKHLSEEHRQKISDSRKGKTVGVNHPMYGKHHTDETIEKIKEKHRTLNEEQLNSWKSNISSGKKGTKWYNNGIKEICARECPEGFVPGRLKR